MKFLIIHNRYKHLGGEESVVAAQRSIIEAAGHTVLLYQRDYHQIDTWRLGRLKSLFTALYSRRSVREIQAIVEREKPDMALVHNLYPLISPAILPILKQGGVRTAMMLHNFRLICPIGTLFRSGKICEACGKSPLREMQCLKHRCEGTLTGSFAFALRGMWARKKGYFNNVEYLCTLSDFQSHKLSQYGVDAAKMHVITNPLTNLVESEVQRCDFIGIAGRFSEEKGASLFLEAAKMLPHLKFKVAGHIAFNTAHAPENVEFVGKLDSHALADFYSSARVVVSCSIWYETFGLTIVEAMHYGACVIVPDIAAMPSLVDNGHAGLIFKAGDATDLASKIELLTGDRNLWQSLSTKGKAHSDKLCSPDNYLTLITNLLLEIGGHHI